jgi:hypothetical protein
MATKAQPELAIPVEDTPAAQVIDVPPARKPRKVKNYLRQEWEEEVTPDATAAPHPVAQRQEPNENLVSVYEEPDFLEVEENNPFEELLAEIGTGAEDYKVSIWELPNYRHDGNGSLAHAENNFCGNIPIPRSVRTKADLLQLIQEKYARGNEPFYDYLLSVRGRRIKRNLPIVRIKSLGYAQQSPTQSSEGNHVVSAAVAVAPVDPLEAFKKQAEIFREMKKIFGTEPKQAEVVLPTGQPLTTEAALLRLLSDDPDQVSRIAARFLPSERNSDDVPGWLKAILPLAAPLLSALAQKLLAPVTPNDSTPPMPSPGAAPATPVSVAPQEAPPQFAAYQYWISQILFGIENAIAPDYVAEGIGLACDKDESLTPFLEPIFNAPAETVQQMLAQISPRAAQVVNRPNALQWLRDMQSYFGEGDDAK